MYGLQTIKTLLRDKMFVAGVIFFVLLLSMALIGYVAIPEDVRTSWYLNPRWELNPKLAPPCWLNSFSQVSCVPSLNITYVSVVEYWKTLAEEVWKTRYNELVSMGITDEELLNREKARVYSKLQSAYEGRGLSFFFTYTFYEDKPPSDIAVILVSPDRDLDVSITAYLLRPDETELRFTVRERVSLRGGAETIVKLSHSRDLIDKLVRMLLTSTGDLATISALRDQMNFGLTSPVEVFFYGSVGSGGVVSLSNLIRGNYTIRVDLISYNQSSDGLREGDILIKLRVIGSCHGILGTDNMGRDNLWTLLAGSSIALLIGLPYALISRLIGLIYGATSGFFGGTLVDMIMQRACEVVYAMPYLPFIIMIYYTIKETSGASIGIPHIIGLLVLFGWSGTAIVSRSMALSIREEPYVELARAVGASKTRIIFKHIIPQLMPYFFASVMLATPGAILTEVFLSVLGLTDPNMPSWGK